MSRNFVSNFLFKLNFVANLLGFSIFKFSKNSFNISWLGIAGLIFNFIINVSQIYFIIEALQISYFSDHSKSIKTFTFLGFIELYLINFCSVLVMIMNVILSKNILKTFNKVVKLEHEVNFYKKKFYFSRFLNFIYIYFRLKLTGSSQTKFKIFAI